MANTADSIVRLRLRLRVGGGSGGSCRRKMRREHEDAAREEAMSEKLKWKTKWDRYEERPRISYIDYIDNFLGNQKSVCKINLSIYRCLCPRNY